MVEQAANMNLSLRIGNLCMAKLLELFWWFPMEPRLSDVGCTFRALEAATWQKIRSSIQEMGPAFSPEMIAQAYAHNLRVIEIPVHYGARLGGESKHSRNLPQRAATALAMLRVICRVRLETLLRSPGAA